MPDDTLLSDMTIGDLKSLMGSPNPANIAITVNIYPIYEEDEVPEPPQPPDPPTPPEPPEPPEPPTPPEEFPNEVISSREDKGPRLWSHRQQSGGEPDAGDGLPVLVQCNREDGKAMLLDPSDLMVARFRKKMATEGGHKDFLKVDSFANEEEAARKYLNENGEAKLDAGEFEEGFHIFWVLEEQVKDAG